MTKRLVVLMCLLFGALLAQTVEAAFVTGQLVDEQSVAVTTTRGAKLWLYYVQPPQQPILKNTTNCAQGVNQGCARSDGSFYFTKDSDGNDLPFGNYKLLAQGNLLLSQWVSAKSDMSLVTITMLLNPILLQTGFNPNCSVSPTQASCDYFLVRKLESVQRGPATIPVNVYADVITPNITSPNTTTIPLPTQSFNLAAEGPLVVFTYVFPADSTAGFETCFNIRAGLDRDHIYREVTMRCVVKPEVYPPFTIPAEPSTDRPPRFRVSPAPSR